MSTEVFWAARDLDTYATPVGNHHFILIMLSPGHSVSVAAKTEGSKRFVTLGGFKKQVGGKSRLIYEANNAADVTSVREVIDPGQHTSIWKPDYDMESHKVSPPGKLSGIGFADRCVQLARTYAFNEKLRPVEYTLANQNCSAWVNCLLKAAGVPRATRLKAGEFSGVDWGEEDQLPKYLFQRIIARAGQMA